tara:strand:- start:86 stop:445 length:360 start_codon:yes stop_codon:yes gene_type:complete
MVDVNLLIIILVVVFVVVVVCSLLYCFCWGRLCACCTRRKRARHGYAGLHGGESGTVIHIHNEDSDARQQRQQLLDEVRALRGDDGEPPDLSQLRTNDDSDKELKPVEDIQWWIASDED